MSTQNAPYRRDSWLLALLAGAILLSVVFGFTHLLASRWVVIVVLGGVLVMGTLAVWIHARATGTPSSHWWEDDSCSGWRGF